MEPPLHPDCRPIAFLLGVWEGEGRGAYPTIDPFRYTERVEMWHVGKPHLLYTQRTRALDDGRPLHSEMGYWRPQPDGRVELVLAQPTGHAEVALGTVRSRTIEVATVSIGASPSAKDVVWLERRFEVDGDTLSYQVRMAAVGVDLTEHLVGELRRVG